MNTGTFTGHIGSDAELRNTTGGDTVANFSIAVNVGTKAKPETLWVDCQMWGDRGEKLVPYLLKGTKVTAIGRVKLRTFSRQDGTQGTSMQLQINEIDLHGRREQGQHDSHETPKPRYNAPAGAAAPNGQFTDDDIPF